MALWVRRAKLYSAETQSFTFFKIFMPYPTSWDESYYINIPILPRQAYPSAMSSTTTLVFVCTDLSPKSLFLEAGAMQKGISNNWKLLFRMDGSCKQVLTSTPSVALSARGLPVGVRSVYISLSKGSVLPTLGKIFWVLKLDDIHLNNTLLRTKQQFNMNIHAVLSKAFLGWWKSHVFGEREEQTLGLQNSQKNGRRGESEDKETNSILGFSVTHTCVCLCVFLKI